MTHAVPSPFISLSFRIRQINAFSSPVPECVSHMLPRVIPKIHDRFGGVIGEGEKDNDMIKYDMIAGLTNFMVAKGREKITQPSHDACQVKTGGESYRYRR